MNKMLLVHSVAVAALTSCTSDEVVEVNSTATIQFESFVNRGTRSVTAVENPDNVNDGNLSGLKKFYVFGYYGNGSSVFNNVSVTKVEGGNSIVWNYGSAKPWAANQRYQFAAYATKNDSEELNANFANGVLTFNDFAVTDDRDLVIAYVQDHQAGRDVALNFQHKLAKVLFTFTNKSEDGLQMRIEDLKFKLKQTGNYNSSSPNEWTVNSSVAETELTFNDTPADTYIDVDGNHVTNQHFVLPQQLGTIKASFVAKYYDEYNNLVETIPYTDIILGGETVQELTGEYWKPGFAYNYTADLPVTPTYIKFTVTVEPNWENGGGDTGTSNVDKTTGNGSISF